MGAYKPRTNPYSSQGHGKECLPWVFDLAGKYGIKVIAMEITHDSHLHEIQEALHKPGKPTGVMIQIGTRNTQNFELLKIVGRQRELPVLLKRGFNNLRYSPVSREAAGIAAFLGLLGGYALLGAVLVYQGEALAPLLRALA